MEHLGRTAQSVLAATFKDHRPQSRRCRRLRVSHRMKEHTREQKMNDTIRLLQAHHSDRSYKSDPIPDEILDNIIEAAHRAPTSINTQQVSIIVVKDAGTRKRISEIAGGQPWIAKAPVFLLLVADLFKTRIASEKTGSHRKYSTAWRA